MSWPVLLALLALAVSLAQRWRRAHEGHLDLEGLTLQLALWLGLVGLLATGLALAGRFGAIELSVASAAAAAALWPWRARTFGRPMPRIPRLRTALGVALVLGGLALRFPLIPSPLAGRDQGTYTLRAQHTLRTGRLGLTDELLREETEASAERSGPADVVGLRPRSDETWRRGVYETSYRPGFYLVDRDAGKVVPQFLHLHPMLMAASGLALGPTRVADVLWLETTLALMALWAIARRLWRHGPWAELTLALIAFSPLVIWVNRVALTETLMTGLYASAVLAVLRAREGEPALLIRAALLFGLTAWVRGNAWITAPVAMGVLLLRPRVFRPGRGALLTLTVSVLASVVVHALTGFPYLYDELHRMLPNSGGFGRAAIIGGAVLLALVVVGTDLALTLGLRRPPRRLLRWLAHAPKGLAALGVGAVVAYVAMKIDGPEKPFSRLDPVLPMFGPAAIVAAAAGLVGMARGWRPRWRQADLWLLALATVPVITAVLYARRNLPQAGLYYYGRYLVPELLPVTMLLAVDGIRRAHGWLHTRKRFVAHAAAAVAAMALLWLGSGVLVTHPQTRLREFEGAARAVDWLAQNTEEDAVIIAGGEGWHHGHTYNQVGGALAIGHGRAVLAYETREAAYATLEELLIRRPEARGLPPPPVYLLLNEASHQYTRADGARVAGLDDGLPPPFRIGDAKLIELFTDRLTPVTQEVPIRVTRDALRMALLRIELDAAIDVRRWEFAGVDAKTLRTRDGIKAARQKPRDGRWCLHPKRPLVLTFPPPEHDGPGELVIVAEPGTARRNEEWRIKIDGKKRAPRMPEGARRERDTLGPFVSSGPPRRVELKGSRHASADAVCPHGGLLELRWLPGAHGGLAAVDDATAITIAPPDTLGHPVTPTAWVSARALSRYRPGTRPKPAVHGRSLALGPRKPLRFRPVFGPDAGAPADVDIVVTLTTTSLSPEARIVLRIDGEELARFDPPDQREGSWQSEVIRARLEAPLVEVELELTGDDDPEHWAGVRDVAIFGISHALASHLLP